MSGSDTDSGFQKAESCNVFISDRGLHAFLSLAERHAAGQEITLDDARELAENPVYTAWRHSFVPQRLDVETISRGILFAVAGPEALTVRQRAAHTPTSLVLSLQDTWTHRDLVSAFVADFVSEDRACGILTLLGEYLPASDLPDTLHLEFAAIQPEIRYIEDAFMIDSGLAWAMGRNQVVRAVASVLYKIITAYDRPYFFHLQDIEILLHTLRHVHHEAIPAYIDGIDQKAFDMRHQRLAGSSVSEFEVLQKAHLALLALEARLTQVRTMEAPSQDDWMVFHNTLIERDTAQPAGWFMARTIVDQLGKPHLKRVSRSVADFFAAYQEACALLPQRPDIPRQTEQWFKANPPRLSEENAAWIDDELRRLFP